MIDIRNVTKSFYDLKAIDNVSLQIPRGEVVGLLGPNGAGKTTLFKLIAGLLKPDKGRVGVRNGRSWPAIGYKPDRLLFPNHLRISDYLQMIAALSNVPKANIEKAVFDSLVRVDLVSAANKRLRTCSKGMRQRVGLAQALIGNPPLLLLDEPSNGLDPTGQAEMSQHIQELHAAGKTIIISSHQLHEVTQVCTQLVILNHGTIHYRNSMADALATRSHLIIHADKDLEPLQQRLTEMNGDVVIQGSTLTLQGEAMAQRRPILIALLSEGYDVVHVEEKRATLAEIYAEAVQ